MNDFFVQKIRTVSVSCADSGDTKILVQFPGNSILEFSTIFWKCVGGFDMRGWIPTRNYWDIHFPGNRFEFGIISNDFWSSTIWACHIPLLLNEVENPKEYYKDFTYVGWIPGFFGVSTSFSKIRIWLAQIEELQKSFDMIPNSNRFPGYWISKIIFLAFAWAFE